MKSLLMYAALILLVAPAAQSATGSGSGSTDSTDESSSGLQEVVVSARKRDEKLQDVPDAVTAFTAETIQNAGIQQIADFAILTPNMNFKDGSAYTAAFYNLSMRGIGQGQQGWPSVAFIVDGVPADSADALTEGALQNVERIEVLRGPQSALYGAGAIAGAINIVTRRPQNELEVNGRLLYGNGADRQATGTVSGALVPDKLLGSVTVGYRDFVGLIRSASNELPLDFRDSKQLQTRLIFTPTDNFEADLRGTYTTDHNGSTYQDALPSPAYQNDFNPMFDARRRTPGTDNRTFDRISLRLKLDLAAMSVISISSYGKTNEHGFVSLCYDDPDDPLYPRLPDGGIECTTGEAYGSAALPGQAIDNFFASVDKYKSYSEDLRLESAKGSAVEWLVGASGMYRDALDGFDILNVVAPNNGRVEVFPSFDVRKDTWWGVYGQASVKAHDVWEFTLAARYDDQKYTNTAYTDGTLTTVAPAFSTTGALIDTQHEKGNALQPKGQISYHFNPDRMAYVTVSRGFRAGYFDTGAFAVPEHTTNYELGLKSSWWHRHLTTNIAVFHIDYSDQQTSTTIGQPPYRLPVTIPKTKIDGVETELTAAVTDTLTFSTNVGYLNAKVGDGTRSPAAPLFSGSVSVQLLQPLTDAWRLNARADLIFHSSEYLFVGDTQQIPGNTFLNLRAGAEYKTYGLYAYCKNATNVREDQMEGAFNAGLYERYQNPNTPIYGVELLARF